MMPDMPDHLVTAAAGGTPTPARGPGQRIRATRATAVAILLALIVLGLAWELWLAPLPGGRGALALKVLPLTLALAGLLKNRMYTYRWLSLLVWLYVAEGALRASTESGLSARLALVEAVLSVALFAACAAHVRWRLAVRDRGSDDE
jgi:uncharacterized membrane protein